MALDRVSSDRIREIRLERKKKLRVRILILCISIIVIISSIIFISRSSQLQIVSVVVRGNYIVSTDEIISVVNNNLDNNYLYFFPERNVFLYPNHYINKQIAEKFPRLEKVNVNRINWNTIIIDVSERKNLYLYCDDSFLTSDVESHCYYVDAHGYIFSSAPSFSGNVYFIFLGNFGWDNGDNPIGKQITSVDKFSEIVRFKEGLEENNLKAYGLRTYSDGSYAFLLSSLFDDTKQKIILSSNDDISNSYSDLVSALNAEVLKKELTNNFDKLEYINLRYGKKVYYKFGQ